VINLQIEKTWGKETEFESEYEMPDSPIAHSEAIWAGGRLTASQSTATLGNASVQIDKQVDVNNTHHPKINKKTTKMT
jgi:hypothetical protein